MTVCWSLNGDGMTRKYRRKTTTRKAPRTAFKKGFDPRRKIGRDKGVPNKFSSDLKQMILNALHKQGGEEWFAALARKDKRSFSGLLGRLLPTKIGGDPGNPVQIEAVKSGLGKLDDKELATLEKLFTKIGVTLP